MEIVSENTLHERRYGFTPITRHSDDRGDNERPDGAAGARRGQHRRPYTFRESPV
jgi:hypothetical protein